jgi:hypothetical protein
MDAFANKLAIIALWAMPIVWLVASWLTWARHSWIAGICFLIAGLCTALWNFFFLPITQGRDPDDLWRVMIFVNYEDAPLGHFLSVYLPFIAKVSLVVAVALLIFKHET